MCLRLWTSGGCASPAPSLPPPPPRSRTCQTSSLAPRQHDAARLASQRALLLHGPSTPAPTSSCLSRLTSWLRDEASAARALLSTAAAASARSFSRRTRAPATRSISSCTTTRRGVVCCHRPAAGSCVGRSCCLQVELPQWMCTPCSGRQPIQHKTRPSNALGSGPRVIKKGAQRHTPAPITAPPAATGP